MVEAYITGHMASSYGEQLICVIKSPMMQHLKGTHSIPILCMSWKMLRIDTPGLGPGTYTYENNAMLLMDNQGWQRKCNNK